MNWYAVITRPNLEKIATAALQGKGLEAYLPLYRIRRRYSDRVKELELPLFPSYTFCRLDPCRRKLVLSTPGTMGIVGFGNGPAPIDEAEMMTMRKVVESRLSVRPWCFVKIGQRVIVQNGPLTGVEGIVLKLKKEFRLVVSITMLQRSVAVDIDQESVGVVSSKPSTPAWNRDHERAVFAKGC